VKPTPSPWKRATPARESTRRCSRRADQREGNRQTTKAAIVGIEACASESELGLFGRCAKTGAGGEYTITGLATGSYTVEFFAASSSGPSYAKRCRAARCRFRPAPRICRWRSHEPFWSFRCR
jgi:hypothetical protein